MNKVLYHTVRLYCNTDYAFEMFTEYKYVQKWLTKRADVEPRIGGKYELFWDPKDRENDSTIGCKITSMEKDKFLSFEWKGPEIFQSFMNFCDPLTHVVVVFAPSSDEPKKTTVFFFHSGWRDDPEWQKARNYFEKAWSGALTGLKEKLST